MGGIVVRITRLKLNYTYSGATANNLNILSQTITVPGMASTLVQNYTYDELNRLKTAAETTGGGTPTWNQVYGYDRFGNRNITSGTGATNFGFSGNRITTHSYDLAGNTIGDGTGRSFTYDAENKQTKVNNGAIGEYWYDGDGKRVKKYAYNDTSTTVFVYDAFGKLVAEYSTNVIPASNAQVIYTTNDHLGSPRINADKSGAVVSNRCQACNIAILSLRCSFYTCLCLMIRVHSEDKK